MNHYEVEYTGLLSNVKTQSGELGLLKRWGRADASYQNAYQTLLSMGNESQFKSSREAEKDAEELFSTANNVINGKRPFDTTKGYIGLNSPCLQIGEVVVISHGADVPFLP